MGKKAIQVDIVDQNENTWSYIDATEPRAVSLGHAAADTIGWISRTGWCAEVPMAPGC